MTTRQRKIFSNAQSELRAGNAAAAIAGCEQGLGEFPQDVNLMCMAAKAAIAARQIPLARQYVERALALRTDFALAHDVNGDLLLVEGRTADALDAWQEALRLDPSRAGVSKKLRQVRQDHSGQPKLAFADRLATAAQLEKDGDEKGAEDIYRKILKVDPDHVEASRLLAGVATRHEHYREAEVFLKRSVELSPDYARAWADLANVQRLLEDFEPAIASATRLVELAPDQPESHLLYASIVGAAGQHEDAIAAYRKVLEIAPDTAGAMCSMAHQLKTVGRQDEAVDQYREAIAVRGGHAESYWSLANLKTFRFSESEVDDIHAMLERDSLDDEARLQLHNALGLEYEAREQYSTAFSHFEQCNLLRRRHESYDPVDTEDTTSRVIEQFDGDFLGQPAGPPVEPTPIFIVGLPRSGSTLVEQILASHSSVEGTHELSDLARVLRKARRQMPGQPRFPEAFAKHRAARWARLGRQYIDSTAKYRSGQHYFIDKNPNNFIFSGLIRLAMPNAKIINARRHPLDSCLGSYKQLFASGQPFTYDLVELGEYYLQYQRLMDHWHTVLPGFVLDVHYENVVADLEQEVRRLLDFCGLPFEESCLRFHETERAVKTASSEQVRRPIYSTSIDRWRNYEDEVVPLIHILKPLLPE